MCSRSFFVALCRQRTAMTSSPYAVGRGEARAVVTALFPASFPSFEYPTHALPNNPCAKRRLTCRLWLPLSFVSCRTFLLVIRSGVLYHATVAVAFSSLICIHCLSVTLSHKNYLVSAATRICSAGKFRRRNALACIEKLSACWSGFSSVMRTFELLHVEAGRA